MAQVVEPPALIERVFTLLAPVTRDRTVMVRVPGTGVISAESANEMKPVSNR